jgi:hypothetical protein
MGTLPPAISGFSPDKLPFGRMMQLSITAPTIGGWDFEFENLEDQGIYGPCPIGSLPVLIDTYLNGGDLYTRDNAQYGVSEPWQFHTQDVPLQPYLVDPPTAPWDSTRRIQYWNKVQYDYTTNNSLTGLSGTGPRLVGDTSDGQIIITAPEDRPVPYVAWLNLSLNVYWDGFGVDGHFTGGLNALSNVIGPTVGIVRHTAPADNLNYRLVACEEITNFYIGDLLTVDFYKDIDGTHDSFMTQTSEGIRGVHGHGKRFVSLFGFDVVPPNESYIIYAGWQHSTINDWIISTVTRDQILGWRGNGFWNITGEAPTTYNLDGTQWDSPMNRFGVMTF